MVRQFTFMNINYHFVTFKPELSELDYNDTVNSYKKSLKNFKCFEFEIANLQNIANYIEPDAKQYLVDTNDLLSMSGGKPTADSLLNYIKAEIVNRNFYKEKYLVTSFVTAWIDSKTQCDFDADNCWGCVVFTYIF